MYSIGNFENCIIAWSCKIKMYRSCLNKVRGSFLDRICGRKLSSAVIQRLSTVHDIGLFWCGCGEEAIVSCHLARDCQMYRFSDHEPSRSFVLSDGVNASLPDLSPHYTCGSSCAVHFYNYFSHISQLDSGACCCGC